MPCTPFELPGGGRGFLCTRGPRPRCVCGKLGAFQCDAPSKRRSGTCDKHLCASCATDVGPDRHLCPVHAGEAAPVQEGLF
jgi:hypothetical protein